jgi:hypothetical protein
VVQAPVRPVRGPGYLDRSPLATPLTSPGRAATIPCGGPAGPGKALATPARHAVRKTLPGSLRSLNVRSSWRELVPSWRCLGPLSGRKRGFRSRFSNTLISRGLRSDSADQSSGIPRGAAPCLVLRKLAGDKPPEDHTRSITGAANRTYRRATAIPERFGSQLLGPVPRYSRVLAGLICNRSVGRRIIHRGSPKLRSPAPAKGPVGSQRDIQHDDSSLRRYGSASGSRPEPAGRPASCSRRTRCQRRPTSATSSASTTGTTTLS